MRSAVEDNLRHLGLEAMEVVNLRIMGDVHSPSEGSIAPLVEVAAELRREGLVRHVGLSNMTAAQVAEARAICPIVCVQNMYNLGHRHDDALIDRLADEGVAFVPFFPLGGFSPLQSDALTTVATRLGALAMSVALAWLLHRSPNILLIPGTSSITHLRDNIDCTRIALTDDDLAELDRIGRAGARRIGDG